MASEEQQSLEVLIAGLQEELARENTFERATTFLTCMFRDSYPSASEAEKEAMYTAACRAATLLQTRYTAPDFWTAGLKLFEQAEGALENPAEKRSMRGFIEKVRAFLEEQSERQDLPPEMRAGPSSGGILLEGQLPVGAEPPQPPRLGEEARTVIDIVSSIRREDIVVWSERNMEFISELARDRSNDFSAELDWFEEVIAPMQAELGNAPRGPPPAAKAEVAKLPVIDVTEEVLSRIGGGTECVVCHEVLVVGDKIQEMPCKHSFHPNCLKPWLDEHNSCPTCRYELRTDDPEYELKKERDREFEEDRKGREDALPGGEYMYT